MENSTLRLIYPQWQGGIISHWIPELNPDDATTGYYLGSQLLNYLAPKTNQEVITVPIHKDIGKRVIQDGVIDRDVIAEQTKAALDSIKQLYNPEDENQSTLSIPKILEYLGTSDADIEAKLTGNVYTGLNKIQM